MARLDDLTILLTMVDKTGKAFKSVDKKLARMQKLTLVVGGAFKKMGKVIGATFVAAGVKGALLTNDLIKMSRSTKETIRETQALFLAVQENNATVTLDSMNEAMLTLKERFADAAIGTGPLKGLIDDLDGFELDLGVDNGRDQLADFLEQVAKLPKANQRIFALKEVMSDTEANMFLPAVNGDIEKLDMLLDNLRAKVEDLPNIMSASDAQNVKNTKVEISKLNIAWQRFSAVVYQLVAPALGAIVKLFTWALNKAATLTEKIKEMFRIGQDSAEDILKFDDPTTNQSRNEQLATIQKRIDLIQDETKEKQRLQEITAKDDYSKAQQRAKAVEMKKQENKLAEDLNLLLQRRIELEAMVLPDPSDIGNLPNITAPSLVTTGNSPETDPVDTPDLGESVEQGVIAAQFSEMMEATQAMQQMRDSITAGIIENAKLVGEALAKAQTEAQERSLKIQGALLGVGNAFGKMADLAANKSEKSFKVFKRIQIALATVAAYSAAVQSLGEAKGDPLLRIAAYAQILSVGLGAIAQMRSVNVGGGGGSAGASASAGSNTPQSTARGGAAPTEPRSGGRNIIQLEGRGNTYGDDDIENIAEGFRRLGIDMEVVFN